MFQRDYIMRMVEELAKVLARLTGLINTGNLSTARKILEETYQDTLGDSGKLIKYSEDKELPETLIQLNWGAGQMEALAKLLEKEADLLMAEGNFVKGKECYSKSLHLLHFLEKETKTFSMDRQQIISRIQKQLRI